MNINILFDISGRLTSAPETHSPLTPEVKAEIKDALNQPGVSYQVQKTFQELTDSMLRSSLDTLGKYNLELTQDALVKIVSDPAIQAEIDGAPALKTSVLQKLATALTPSIDWLNKPENIGLKNGDLAGFSEKVEAFMRYVEKRDAIAAPRMALMGEFPASV